MKDMDLTVSDIKELVNIFSKSGLEGMKLRQGGFELELKSRSAIYAADGPAGSEADAVEVAAILAPPVGNVVKSPIVGTFYAAPAPDKDPYVIVGAQVKKGDILFIIESMKLMNEVTSDFDGVVTEILIENGTAVEYGQPIIVIS